jgi:hypothetical protein
MAEIVTIGGGTSRLMIRSFDPSTFHLRWAYPVAGTASVAFTPAGANRFAYTTQDHALFIADVGQGHTVTVVKAGSGNGTVLSTAAGLDCGTSCIVLVPADPPTLALTAIASIGSRFVRWEGDPDCADGVVVSNADINCRAVFEQLVAGLDTTVPLLVNDLAYDTAHGRLYASIPGQHPAYGNGVALIDPATGAVLDWRYVGSEPNKLALSDDGAVLYVGLDGARAVRRVEAMTLTAGLQFPLGSGSMGPCTAIGIAVFPGDPSSIAVLRQSGYGSNDGIATYTDGVMRPQTAAGVNPFGELVFSGASDRLYARTATDPAGFVRLAVSSSGVTVIDSMSGLLVGRGPMFYFDGNVFSGFRIVSAEARTPVATLPSLSVSGDFMTSAALDVGGIVRAGRCVHLRLRGRQYPVAASGSSRRSAGARRGEGGQWDRPPRHHSIGDRLWRQVRRALRRGGDGDPVPAGDRRFAIRAMGRRRRLQRRRRYHVGGEAVCGRVRPDDIGARPGCPSDGQRPRLLTGHPEVVRLGAWIAADVGQHRDRDRPDDVVALAQGSVSTRCT